MTLKLIKVQSSDLWAFEFAHMSSFSRLKGCVDKMNVNTILNCAHGKVELLEDFKRIFEISLLLSSMDIFARYIHIYFFGFFSSLCSRLVCSWKLRHFIGFVVQWARSFRFYCSDLMLTFPLEKSTRVIFDGWEWNIGYDHQSINDIVIAYSMELNIYRIAIKCQNIRFAKSQSHKENRQPLNSTCKLNAFFTVIYFIICCVSILSTFEIKRKGKMVAESISQHIWYCCLLFLLLAFSNVIFRPTELCSK